MCFDVDSEPPLPPVRGGAVEHRRLTLTAADGNRFAAFEARSAPPGGTAVVVLPDVRGLFRFYEELALRLAGEGYDAVAIDYFGRTAGEAERDEDFEFWPHVEQTTYAGMCHDVAAAVAHLRSTEPGRSVFTLGFCFGGSNSWYQAASDLGLAGAIGFYGHPDYPDFPTGAPGVIRLVDRFHCPLLGLMGGDDQGVPVDEVTPFVDRLRAAGAPAEFVFYPGAPHSFFDRKYEEFAAESRNAWHRVLGFLARYETPARPG